MRGKNIVEHMLARGASSEGLSAQTLELTLLVENKGRGKPRKYSLHPPNLFA